MSQERMEAATKPKSIFSGLAQNAPQIERSVEQAKVMTNKVRVVHGANGDYYPVVGSTVGDIRKKLKDILNLSSDVEASVDGKNVGDDFILAAGQNLEFSKSAGEKG